MLFSAALSLTLISSGVVSLWPSGSSAHLLCEHRQRFKGPLWEAYHEARWQRKASAVSWHGSEGP